MSYEDRELIRSISRAMAMALVMVAVIAACVAQTRVVPDECMQCKGGKTIIQLLAEETCK